MSGRNKYKNSPVRTQPSQFQPTSSRYRNLEGNIDNHVTTVHPPRTQPPRLSTRLCGYGLLIIFAVLATLLSIWSFPLLAPTAPSWLLITFPIFTATSFLFPFLGLKYSKSRNQTFFYLITSILYIAATAVFFYLTPFPIIISAFTLSGNIVSAIGVTVVGLYLVFKPDKNRSAETTAGRFFFLFLLVLVGSIFLFVINPPPVIPLSITIALSILLLIHNIYTEIWGAENVSGMVTPPPANTDPKDGSSPKTSIFANQINTQKKQSHKLSQPLITVAAVAANVSSSIPANTTPSSPTITTSSTTTSTSAPLSTAIPINTNSPSFFTQSSQNLKSGRKLVIFDLDQTLIPKHTAGTYDTSPTYNEVTCFPDQHLNEFKATQKFVTKRKANNFEVAIATYGENTGRAEAILSALGLEEKEMAIAGFNSNICTNRQDSLGLFKKCYFNTDRIGQIKMMEKEKWGENCAMDVPTEFTTVGLTKEYLFEETLSNSHLFLGKNLHIIYLILKANLQSPDNPVTEVILADDDSDNIIALKQLQAVLKQVATDLGKPELNEVKFISGFQVNFNIHPKTIDSYMAHLEQHVMGIPQEESRIFTTQQIPQTQMTL